MMSDPLFTKLLLVVIDMAVRHAASGLALGAARCPSDATPANDATAQAPR